MNVRIIENDEVVMEVFDVDFLEIPEEKTTILVKGLQKHCYSILKSYEVYNNENQVWFVVHVW